MQDTTQQDAATLELAQFVASMASGFDVYGADRVKDTVEYPSVRTHLRALDTGPGFGVDFTDLEIGWSGSAPGLMETFTDSGLSNHGFELLAAVNEAPPGRPDSLFDGAYRRWLISTPSGGFITARMVHSFSDDYANNGLALLEWRPAEARADAEGVLLAAARWAEAAAHTNLERLEAQLREAKEAA